MPAATMATMRGTATIEHDTKAIVLAAVVLVFVVGGWLGGLLLTF